MKALFTPEELEAMRMADGEIEREFVMTAAERADGTAGDKEHRTLMASDRKNKITAYQAAYYAEHKEEKAAYRAEHRDAYNAYMRGYMRQYRKGVRRREGKAGEKASCAAEADAQAGAD